MKENANQSEPAMVCSANDLRVWRDFPKGLQVLLLDDDSNGAAEIKSTLEGMDYIVSTYYNENEAIEAISSKAENFHVAIVEVNTSNSNGSFGFLERAKDLPTIMISNNHCISTMMKCIAFGATEFLEKPISEEKLKNIWQHVVHKAFNAGESVLSKSLKPVKDTVASMIQLHLETAQEENQNPSETENRTRADMLEHKPSLSNDRFPAPSTPQLEQGKRLFGDGDCQDQTNWLVDKETREQDDGLIELRIPSCSKSKYVENSLENFDSGVAYLMPNSPSKLREVAIEEVNSLVKDGSISLYSRNGDNLDPSSKGGKQTKGTVPTPSSSCKSRISRKKMKVDWTPKLHKQFVQAVELLGINQAIPSKILELMKVEGLTRHNVASHLQKYRMHRRPIMPKEDELTSWRIWQQQRYPMQMSTYPHKAVMAFSPYPTNQLYPVWGHPSNIQIWGSQGYPTWQPFHHGMHADAWGCPVAQVQNPYPFYPQNLSPCHGLDVGEDYGNEAWRNSLDLFTDEEEAMIDAVLREAINNPWLPLPLGLKSPSIESVLADLERQGITAVPLRTTTPQI